MSLTPGTETRIGRELSRGEMKTANFGKVAPEPAPDPGRILMTDLNTFLRGCGARRPAEALVLVLGVIGLRVLALEVQR